MHFAKEMGSTDESFSNTGYEPKDYALTETYVEFNQESMTEQRFPEQRFLEDVDYDDAAIGEMLFLTHTENKSILLATRPVCWSVVVNAPIERGNPLLKKVKNKTMSMHRLGCFRTERGGKSSPTVRKRLEDTNSRLIMTEEV